MFCLAADANAVDERGRRSAVAVGYNAIGFAVKRATATNGADDDSDIALIAAPILPAAISLPLRNGAQFNCA